MQQAAEVKFDAERNPDNYEGSEGSDVQYLLEQIYNAYCTGDPTNDIYADEIFK